MEQVIYKQTHKFLHKYIEKRKKLCQLFFAMVQIGLLYTEEIPRQKFLILGTCYALHIYIYMRYIYMYIYIYM
jgi:hypothetical protein